MRVKILIVQFSVTLSPDPYRWSAHQLLTSTDIRVASLTFCCFLIYGSTLIALSSLMRDLTSMSSENNKSSQHSAAAFGWHLLSYFGKGLSKAANFQLGSDHCVSHIITSSEESHWPPPSTSRPNYCLTLPVGWEASSARTHPQNTHTHS